MPQPVTDATFQDQVLSNNKVALVDFWATWCGPCTAMAPIYEAVSKQYEGKAEFFKMDVDENQQTSMNYQIMSIPTIVVFKNGQPVDQIVGAVPQQTLEQKVQQHLA